MLVASQFSSTKDAMARWGDEKTLYFILLYRNHECLWNSRSPLYKNKIAREYAYRSILESFNDSNLDLKCIKTKIKNLRSVYHTELKKVKDSRNAGSDGPVYKPSLSWFEEMHSFLGAEIESQQSVEHHENISMINNELETQKTSDETKIEAPVIPIEHITVEATLDSDIREEPTDAFDNVPEKINDSQNFALPCTTSTPVPDPPTKFTERSKIDQRKINRRKRPHEDDLVIEVLDRLDSLVNNVVENTLQRQLTQAERKDEFHMFGLSVAAQLKSLPLHTAIELQSKIQNILAEARLASIAQQTENATSSLLVKNENITDD